MDRLTLKGYKDVIGQTGSELTYIAPVSGRDFHLFPKWWDKKGTIQYENVSIFKITRIGGGDLRIVIPTSINTHVELLWDNATDTFKFPVHRGVDRVAIISDADGSFLQEYQFSKISGGSVLKRVVASLPAETFTELENSAAQTIAVTVVSDGGNKFALDGTTQLAVTLAANEIVIFDQTDASNSGHPLRIYDDANKTTLITAGVTISGSKLAFQPNSAGTFSYQCSAHAAMGGAITVTA